MRAHSNRVYIFEKELMVSHFWGDIISNCCCPFKCGNKNFISRFEMVKRVDCSECEWERGPPR